MVSAMKKSKTSASSGERRASGCSWHLAMARHLSHSFTFSSSFGSGVMSFSWKKAEAEGESDPVTPTCLAACLRHLDFIISYKQTFLSHIHIYHFVMRNCA